MAVDKGSARRNAFRMNLTASLRARRRTTSCICRSGGTGIAGDSRSPGNHDCPGKLPAITAAVMAECDMLDGARTACRRVLVGVTLPGETVVKGRGKQLLPHRTADCGLKKVYGGAKNPRSGEQIFPGEMRVRGERECGSQARMFRHERAAPDHVERLGESGIQRARLGLEDLRIR
jgi:hypothetical protein